MSEVSAAEADHLPTWDLSDLYSGPDDPALEQDLADAESRAKSFYATYAGQVAALDGASLAAAIAECEAIEETLSRALSFAYLHYAGDMADSERGRLLQHLQERATEISKSLIFFTLAINQLDDDRLASLKQTPGVAAYGPWLRQVRQMRPYELPEAQERLLTDTALTRNSAWTRLFDETLAELSIPVGGEDLSTNEALNLLSDSDPAKRKEAATSLGTVLGQHGRLFKHIHNTLAKDHQLVAAWRGFQRPDEGRNLANDVENHVVDALVEAVVDAYPRLAHRYYAIKARWLTGSDTLDYWDRLAPLPEDDDRYVPWGEAVETVMAAYSGFDSRFADVARQFFDKPWIDAPVSKGKAPGAFSHPTVPSAHPYILLNYHGRRRDVLTLAHELGHGVHQWLAREQGHFLAQTPLTLAETASVFGEMLTFRRLLDQERDPARRRVMLAGKVEDMLGTVVRQIGFYRFEWQLHNARQQGELGLEDIQRIWLDISRESLGPAIRFDDQYAMFWAYIPHFIHAPFYVYAYAFGDCLVNVLYAVYQNAESGFADKYLDMLKAGGTKHHSDLLAPFGLDASRPDFWQQGLQVIESLIDELEQEMPAKPA